MTTLVERTSRFLILVVGFDRVGLAPRRRGRRRHRGAARGDPPVLTWDCSAEMTRHATITATGLRLWPIQAQSISSAFSMNRTSDTEPANPTPPLT
ncbi:MAG: hypothetical protein LC799_11675, partial [Actinobacteria bacterium]|nr:hypothetical protein [Actinomycetota bacterium]